MKNACTLFFLIISVSIFSQIPSYYNDVNLTLKGKDLKDELATKIISTHTNTLSYTPGVWEALKKTDQDPKNASKVVLLYGWNDAITNNLNKRTRNKNKKGGGLGSWNREHTYPKSLATPNLGTSGAGADAHNLRPCDTKKNSSRSNKKFEDGKGYSKITANGNWYPGDEWKGDVARMMLYMYLRYGNQTLPKNIGIGKRNKSDANMVDLFLKWNAEDPVSELELQRNPILEKIQGNRNPFIDNPAFATLIWGGPIAENRFKSKKQQKTTNSIRLFSNNLNTNTIRLNWNVPITAGIVGYNIYRNNKKIATSKTKKITVSGLNANTSYKFYIKAYDYKGEICAKSNYITVKTSSKKKDKKKLASDLIISEYVEGTYYNKALEIANFTGKTVNLSNYSLKKATNGSGKFSSKLSLNGLLKNGAVLVIANTKAIASILSKSDITNKNVLNFNGNDAIALFKKNKLIDVIGNASSNSNYAKNVSLRRKSTVTKPNNSYVLTEWETLKVDTYNGLKKHHIQ